MTTIVSPIDQVSENAYPPIEPPVHHGPFQVAKDTYLIRSLYGEGTAPLAVYMNSLVILGREPVIVDTGTAGNRRRWLEDVFSLVDPGDVRWIFISHDDHDHTGNLAQVLELCRNATLVSSWFQVERLAGDYDLPLNRMRWVDDGEAFDAGDRVLAAIRPPIFDSPTTRGLYDSRSGIYWASDAFAAPVLRAADDVRELDPEFWAQGFLTFQSAISPWHAMLDQAKFDKHVDRIAGLEINAILGAHTPALRGSQIGEALRLMRRLPAAEPARLPGQADLEAMVAALSAGRG